jgi:tight adherence protein B
VTGWQGEMNIKLNADLLGALLCLAIAGMFAGWMAIRMSRTLLHQGQQLVGAQTNTELERMFVFVGAQRLVYLALAAMIMVAAIAWWLSVPGYIIPPLALAGACLPRIVTSWLGLRRRRQLCSQIPGALALWAGLLRSGLGVLPALHQVVGRQSGPLGEELRLLLSQQRVGVPVETAFQMLQERTGMRDLRMLSTLLHLNRDVGGNLAESLQRLADLLTRRLVMEARISSLTAQGKLQGWVVGALPLLLTVVLYVMEPQAMRMLHTTWQGWCALAAIGLLEVVGYVVIRRIVRIDV